MMSDSVNPTTAIGPDDRRDIAREFDRVPELRGIDPAKVGMTRLGGLTNRNFRLDTPKGRFVLRIPGAGTGDYINRKHEAHAARLAARAGVNA